MAKETTATNWKILIQDNTGTFVVIDYVCPYCGNTISNLVFVDAKDASLLDESWGTDQVCSICSNEAAVCCG